MQSIKVTDNGPDDAVVGQLDGLGTALIAIHEAAAEHSIKTDLLDQVVSIIRCRKTPDERIREIASKCATNEAVKTGSQGFGPHALLFC